MGSAPGERQLRSTGCSAPKAYSSWSCSFIDGQRYGCVMHEIESLQKCGCLAVVTNSASLLEELLSCDGCSRDYWHYI
jgi:hypothetical protein